jgi:23S rRNA pseudouridine2605 synthase
VSDMRLQRALARAGVASRRAAEQLIEAGKVRVDGKPATLGMKVDPERQRITVSGRAVRVQPRRWLAFHKPLGVVTTADDEQGRRTVFDFISDPTGLTYVGRLDVMTTGLLLLTTDGEAVHRLTHPRYRIPRRYTALVHGRATAEIAEAVRRRTVIDGRPVVAEQVRVRPGAEGRGLKVERLARLSYGPVRLGDLPPGRSRPLTPAEESGLYRTIRMKPEEG